MPRDTGRAGRRLSLIWHGIDLVMGLTQAMQLVVCVLPGVNDRAPLEPDLAGPGCVLLLALAMRPAPGRLSAVCAMSGAG